MLEMSPQCMVEVRTRRILGRMKRLLLILCVMARNLSAITGLDLFDWKQQIVKPKFLLEKSKDISDNRNAIFYEDKHSFRSQGLGEQIKSPSIEDYGLQPRPVTRSLQCTCEAQYEIRDLGEGHYPRYLTTSLCKPKACQSKFNSCRLLHYVVYVLSQRDSSELSDNPDDVVIMETPLPEALRHKWQLKPMKIPVACVPATG